MNRLYVHIGRHKTGTSSLQKFLFENTAALTTAGFYYPNSAIRGYGHHLFAAPFTKNNLRDNPVPSAQVLEIRQTLLQEIANQIKHQNVIISSEAFQNCDPTVIAETLRPFNPIYVVYIREQVGYLTSSYAQAVQATNLSLSIEDYEQKHFNPHYDRFLANWAQAVGRENLMVRIFERSLLCEEDIVKDFLNRIIHIQHDQWGRFTFHESDQNPSLGRDLIEFKRLLNMAGVSSGRPLYKAFRQLASQVSRNDKPELSQKLYQKVTKRYAKGNMIVGEDYFGDNQILKFKKQTSFPDSTLPKLDLQTITDLTEKLVKIVPAVVQKTPEELLICYKKKSRLPFF